MDLEPCYNFIGNHSQSIPLIQDLPCSFSYNERNYDTKAEIIFNIDGSLNIRTEISLDLIVPFTISGTNHIILNGQKIPVYISSLSTSSGETTILFTSREQPLQITGNDNTRLSRVIFHLFDFKDRIGTSRKVIQTGNSFEAKGVTKLSSSKWDVEILESRTKETGDLQKNHHPALSHVCCLTRPDGSEFDGKSARQVLFDLREFFTFSQGFFCSPIMPVGYDKDGNKTWALGIGVHQPQINGMSWFDPHHSDELAQLFPEFMEKLNDDQWKKTFYTVIYWYVRSNNTSGGGIDTGIILSQIAIERLAYEYSVNCRKLIESNGFKDLKASDKFRLLFASLDIPVEIPDHLPKVQEIAKKFKYIDTPHFLTEIRNSMVHPDHKRHDDFSSHYYDAWRLSLWYLELTILRLCNYQGTYANRLPHEHWVGQVENVPWVKNNSIQQ